MPNSGQGGPGPSPSHQGPPGGAQAPLTPGLYTILLRGIDRPDDWYEVTVALLSDRMPATPLRGFPFRGVWEGRKYTGTVEPPAPYGRLSQAIWVDDDDTAWPTVDEFLAAPVRVGGQHRLWEDGLHTSSYMFEVELMEAIVLFVAEGDE